MKTKSWQLRPDNGRLNLFWTWLDWLTSLGGTYVPLVEDPVFKPRTGRRDADKKPRFYELDPKKYGMDPRTGSIWRREVTT